MVDQLSREGELAIDHDVLVLNLTLYSASSIQSLCPKGMLKFHSSVLSLCRHRTCDPKTEVAHLNAALRADGLFFHPVWPCRDVCAEALEA
jgi:hypothetical protein